MSKLDDIKNKVRASSGQAVHQELIQVESNTGKRKRKPKFDETHTRDTFWVRNDLKKILDETCLDVGRGEKTRIINEALEKYFEQQNNNT